MSLDLEMIETTVLRLVTRPVLQQVDNKNPMNEVEVTPLWHAVMEGHTEVCKLIVNSIVDSDVEVLKSKTDLDKYLNIAVEKGHQEIIRFLNDAKFLFGWYINFIEIVN